MFRQCSASTHKVQWVRRFYALLRLMRLEKPVGIWLLLWPCWWSLALSHHGTWAELLWLMILFAIGAIAMRSAGCVINDLTDRKFDHQVARTRSRPLASGELSTYDALALLAFLLATSLLMVLQLHPHLIYWAVGSLVLVGAYPWMKRITYWPQAFLGLTFNLGALFGWVATQGQPTEAAWWLYAAGICWTIAYDTLYAHQDIEDDLRIGVKSTAIAFGAHSRLIICSFYGLAALMMALAVRDACSLIAYGAPILMAVGGIVMVLQTNLQAPASCLRAFKANHYLAALIWLCILFCI